MNSLRAILRPVGWPAQILTAIHAAVLLTLIALPLASGPYWRFFLFQMVIAAYLAIGFDLSYSYARILSFMHAIFFAIGAYAAAYLISTSAWSLPLLLTAAPVLAGLAGALFGAVLVRMKNHNPTVATVIIASVALLVGNALSAYTGGDDGMRIVSESIGVLGFQIATGPNLVLYYLAATPLVGVVVARYLFAGSATFKVMRAVAQNEVRAEQLGFDVQLRRLAVFIVSAALTGVGGAFYGLMMRHVSTSTLEVSLSVNAILYTMVGGVGTAFGSLLGVLVIYPIAEIISLYFVYVPILIGLLLTLVSLFFPKGILGTLQTRAEFGQTPASTEASATQFAPAQAKS